LKLIFFERNEKEERGGKERGKRISNKAIIPTHHFSGLRKTEPGPSSLPPPKR
jgi:hypothetical protein